MTDLGLNEFLFITRNEEPPCSSFLVSRSPCPFPLPPFLLSLFFPRFPFRFSVCGHFLSAQKKRLCRSLFVVYENSAEYYPRLIASEGQTLAHVPHSVHRSASITYFSPSEIASTGHSPAHVPHAMQSSLITYAIIFLNK